MAINTTLSVTLSAQKMTDLGFTFDSQGNITASPSGIWASATWFANNDTDSGYLQLINNGSALSPTPVLDTSNTVTGFKFTIPAFTETVLKGGVMYVTLASDTSITSDPFAGLTEGQINNLQSALSNNFTFGTFEFTLTGGTDDQGDLTAISTFGFPMSATTYIGGEAAGSVGFNVAGTDIWSDISNLGSTSAPSVYQFDSSTGPLSSDAFAITPTTAVGGSFVPPNSLTLPFASSDWLPYLDSLATDTGTIARISGTYNGAVAPVNNWVTSTNNVQTEVWHNAGYLDYEVSYKESLSVQIGGQTKTVSGFLLSPTEASQVRGYIVIPKGDEAGIDAAWNGGLANSIYSTLGMAQVYAQDPSQVTGQTPYLFQDASAANNGSAADPATSEFFNVGSNTQWGKVFTLFLPGLAAGYIGSTGTAINPLDPNSTVDLDQSWNWDPTFAFDQNLHTRPYGSDPAFQFTDNYAKIFFQNSNVYGDMYSDGLMSLYSTGSPLLLLSNPAGGNVDEINVTVFGDSETPSGYVQPQISNYPWSPGTTPTLVAPSGNSGTYTLNFLNPAGGVGQESFMVDESRTTIAVRVWDPTLNNGAGGFSNSAELPAFPTAQVTISGIAGQEIPQGTVLTTTDAQDNSIQWVVQSTNNYIPAGAGGSLNGELTLTVTANSPAGSVAADTTWANVSLSFPPAVSYSNSSASIPGATSSDPETVTLRFTGDAGASFAAGYIVDAANNQWSFDGGTINGTTGFVDVVATAPAAGISVGANEAWSGMFQNSTVTTEAASVPGLFWSDYAASYTNGELSFVNQNDTGQTPGELEIVGLPLGTNTGDVVWYQLLVTDTQTSTTKTFNFYPSYNENTSGSQNIDGGASIALGTITDQYTINFAGSGSDALPGTLFIPNQVNGNIPIMGTPYAPVIGTQTSTFYQFLGQSVDFEAVANQPTAGSNQLSGVGASSYVFGWTGLNPAALDDGSIGQWTNKVNGLDIVQINVVDTQDASRNQTVFAQGDLDGQWLTGTAAIIEPTGTSLQLTSKAVSLVAGRTYEISYQEFTTSDPGLAGNNPSGTSPISHASDVLTVVINGTSGFLDTASNDQNDFVYSLYEGLLDRVPDQAGFNFWAQVSNQGQSTNAILVEGIANSSEFQAKWGVQADEMFLKAAYAYVLDRAPDTQGFNFWLNELEAGKVTQNQLLQDFLESSEAMRLIDLRTEQGYLAIL